MPGKGSQYKGTSEPSLQDLVYDEGLSFRCRGVESQCTGSLTSEVRRFRLYVRGALVKKLHLELNTEVVWFVWLLRSLMVSRVKVLQLKSTLRWNGLSGFYKV
jgi:hypothetical protein